MKFSAKLDIAMFGNQAGRCLIVSLIFIYILTVHSVERTREEITAIIGSNQSLECDTTTVDVLWTKNGKNITKADKRFTTKVMQVDQHESILDGKQKAFAQALIISQITIKDAGNYTCHDVVSTDTISYFLQPIIKPRIVAHSDVRIRTKASKKVVLYCTVEAYPISNYKSSIKWYKEDDGHDFYDIKETNLHLSNKTKVKALNETHMNVTVELENVSKRDNGTYVCSVLSARSDFKDFVKSESSIFVLERPQVQIDFVKAVGANKIFMNWTINDGNEPILEYFIKYMKEGNPSFTYYNDRIGVKNNSYVLDNFEPSTRYKIELTAKNAIDTGSNIYPDWVKTLETDPVFIPIIEVKGNTHTTITIGWAPPPPELLEYIQYYELIQEATDNSSDIVEAIHLQNSRNLPYMFDNLKATTEYNFRVRACSELTKICGNWSESVSGTTMDGTSSEPLNLKISCSHFNVSRRSSVSVSWDPPANRNGKIISYQVVLTGLATFRFDHTFRNETWGPKTKSVDENFYKATYENVPPNTYYTINVSAITRSKRPGEAAIAHCMMSPTVPDVIGKFLWGKVKTETNDWIFKLNIPRISERNGPICCYRIFLIRIVNNDQYKNLPSPDDLDIMTYHEVHATNNTKGGVYIAEVMAGENFHSEVFLGDGRGIINGQNNNSSEDDIAICRKCLNGDMWRSPQKKKIVTTTTPPPILIPNLTIDDEKIEEEIKEILSTPLPTISRRRRRQHLDLETGNFVLQEKILTGEKPSSITIDSNPFSVFDGQLDLNSEYTGFVEVIVKNKEQILTTYSEYFPIMLPGAPISLAENSDNMSFILNIVVQVLCALILLVLFLLMALCFMHRYYTKHAAQGDEAISLRDSLRALCSRRTQTNRYLIGTPPPDIGPITKHEMPQAYAERLKDSNYGFQHEFEMLPDRFNDRTTKNSDAKENALKNRYPDIKAYDQTRVKLSMNTYSPIGSDYINANFVLGYKERKKFICAQGPMDGTVNDFWRMIWEQHLEMMVMLTNLEEYKRQKCAKYWPEKVNDFCQYGDISVTFVNEEKFADFSIRELKIARRNADGAEEEDRRYITQYHYSVWKDFQAPDHPHGIIKFIKEINAAYSVQRGPILIHCSAGVGRTGTLVALDSLIQQLNDENQVSIFNTVCDLRHQRNFLVQSLRQYKFLYRALLEISQFGHTELPAKGLGAAIEALKVRPNDSKEKCQLEIEFEKIKLIIDETKKICGVGSAEENRSKNRSDTVLPFDTNRVILTPIPTREHSTYINASFIEGYYENSESFIITQDPLENTIGDFWRMVSEQSITTLVMLSEIGDGPRKCPRYWADDEIQYDHILVKYIQSESCPYYTRREFNVTNRKIDDTIQVTQFQYNGWPTVEGEVPEVCRGIIELVDQALKHHNNQQISFASNPGPIAVHCSLGTDRSSIFVAMCSLVQQLRTEKKVDICTTIRKLRSQRNMLIDTYAQYEFLHRAIVNYADLHRLSIDSPSDS